MQRSPVISKHPIRTGAERHEMRLHSFASLVMVVLVGSMLCTPCVAQNPPASPPPAAAATVNESAAKSATRNATGNFLEDANRGFVGDLGVPPPPAMNSIRGIRLPDAAPTENPASPGSTGKPATQAKTSEHGPALPSPPVPDTAASVPSPAGTGEPPPAHR